MIFRILSRLSFKTLYVLSDILYILIYRLFSYRKNVVVSNLQACFPNAKASEIKAYTKDFYKYLCDLIVENIKSYRISKKDIIDRVKFVDSDLVNDYYKKGKSVLILASHSGNWEWSLQSYSAQFDYQVEAVYKKLTNPTFDKIMLKIRTKFGANAIEMSKAGREFLKKRKELRTFAIVADQSPFIGEDKYWAQMFGQNTAYYVGPSQLARMLQCTVIYMDMRKVKRGFYEIHSHVISEPPYDKTDWSIIDNYSMLLEKNILQNPGHWLWSHKRWKYDQIQAEKFVLNEKQNRKNISKGL